MAILLIVVLAIALIASWSYPRYYPAYARRRGFTVRSYPAWSRGHNILLAVVGLILLLWLLGFIRVGNYHSPFEHNITTRPIIRIP